MLSVELNHLQRALIAPSHITPTQSETVIYIAKHKVSGTKMALNSSVGILKKAQAMLWLPSPVSGPCISYQVGLERWGCPHLCPETYASSKREGTYIVTDAFLEMAFQPRKYSEPFHLWRESSSGSRDLDQDPYLKIDPWMCPCQDDL